MTEMKDKGDQVCVRLEPELRAALEQAHANKDRLHIWLANKLVR